MKSAKKSLRFWEKWFQEQKICFCPYHKLKAPNLSVSPSQSNIFWSIARVLHCRRSYPTAASSCIHQFFIEAFAFNPTWLDQNIRNYSPLKQIILCKMSTPLTNIWVKLLWVKQCIWKSQILTVTGRMWNYCWDVIWF